MTHAMPGSAGSGRDDDVYRNLGVITRMLHDALHELGLDKAVESAVQSLPDARARLDYIARVSGESAERVIAHVESAKLQQQTLMREASSVEELLRFDPARGQAIDRALEFASSARGAAGRTDELLTEILMAQSFHDLTTQVIQKVVALAQGLETELVKLLVEMSPEARRAPPPGGQLQGPVIDRERRSDTVDSQAQVDDLLESLGF